ncbi:hypothetical protein BT63DRAFT_224648 [Microthyrium microscopicum]|uniref:Uncharacterized protein n=1 Tax=Microthyrium microscopicum TaxID=703497 RepID=A0A6A6UCC7_9PEZI|nr:hypothetical protein BT63DRAFT_224648 [Microthyrium microscopicum]
MRKSRILEYYTNTMFGARMLLISFLHLLSIDVSSAFRKAKVGSIISESMPKSENERIFHQWELHQWKLPGWRLRARKLRGYRLQSREPPAQRTSGISQYVMNRGNNRCLTAKRIIRISNGRISSHWKLRALKLNTSRCKSCQNHSKSLVIEPIIIIYQG